MGLFSSNTKTVYSCYAAPLYEGMPPLIKQTVASAVINNRNIGSDITANLVNGVLFKANQLYRYAQSGSYHWGLPNDEMTYIDGTSKDNCKSVLEQVEGSPVYISSVVIEPDGLGNYVYTVSYYLLDSALNITGELKEWKYNEGTEVYPTLTIDKLQGASSYYPIIPIRLNSVNLLEKDGYPYKADIRRATRYLGIDANSLYEDINSQDNTDNPPEDMYVLLGVSLSNDTPRTNEYLFRYFEHMYGSSVVTEEEYDYWGNLVSSTTQAPANTVVIKDTQFHAEISWSYITSQVTSDTGTKGAYSITYESNLGRVDHIEWLESTGGVIISWQRTATQRIQYRVHGLVYRSLVLGSQWVSKDCINAFEDPDDPENGEVFIIPLRKDICEEMGSIKSHDLIYESIRLHVNDRYSYKVKWYQTGFGQIFTLVVAVVISVAFQQWQAGSALLTAATAGLILQQVMVALILQPVIATLTQDVLGEELALLVTAIVTAYALNIGVTESGSLVVATTTPTITSISQASLQLIKGIETLDFEAEFEDLSQEQQEVAKLLEVQADEEMQTALDVSLVQNMISNDPYNLMQANNFVTQSRWDIEKPLLLKETTAKYTRVSQFTDIPSSMIRLDVY